MRRLATNSGYFAISSGIRFATTDIPRDVRDTITKSLNAVKEESKGQCLDLTDMNEASRNAANALQEIMKRHNVDDPKFKGKMATLSASLKAYNTRLNNLQNESRSVQREVEGALKLLWGGEEEAAAASGSKPAVEAEGDFGVDVPPIAQKLEEINNTPRATIIEEPMTTETVVETVEGEIISDSTPSSSKATPSSDGASEDLEIEIESPEEQRLSDTKPIHEITQELHEKDIDFTDCLDASSLRRRYQEFLDGKVKSKLEEARAKKQPKASTQTQQPPNPRPPQSQSNYSSPSGGYQPPPPNTNETGLATDPFPNGERKMIDPMQLVSQVKLDIAKEKNMDVNTIDIWSGHIRLEDHKRLYDYPTIQQFPLEVRQKGDAPTGYAHGR